MRRVIFSCLFLLTFVKGSSIRQIITREESENAVRAETGTLGRLVYGIVSTICLCAMSFALGNSLGLNHVLLLTHDRSSRNTIREEKNIAICLDPLPYPDRSRCIACSIRVDPRIRP